MSCQVCQSQILDVTQAACFELSFEPLSNGVPYADRSLTAIAACLHAALVPPQKAFAWPAATVARAYVLQRLKYVCTIFAGVQLRAV